MARNTSAIVSEICLSFPGALEVESRGSPNYRVDGKTFAIYCINQHGDGRVALWLEAPSGSQKLHTQMQPDVYFIPPYVGPKGWLGMDLESGLDWPSAVARVAEAYRKVASAARQAEMGELIRIEGEVTALAPAEKDPFLRPEVVAAMDEIAQRCAKLPETVAATQFGNPVWKAGKKTFISSHQYEGRLTLQFWVGAERQSMLVDDPRFSIPAYTGHNGWIDLDVENGINWPEVDLLLEDSYRHFALQRMLKALDSR